jgi:hypothetical protein
LANAISQLFTMTVHSVSVTCFDKRKETQLFARIPTSY